MKNTVLLFIATLSLIIAPAVSAHVVVKPAEVGVGSFQTFTVGVPNEKDNPTVGLRLVIPEGLEHVSPNVKPGWKIEIKKEGTGEEARVTEIIWSGGSIPAGQRDDFFLSAKVPATETELQWKAYQTYQDGSIVAWDKEGEEDSEESEDENTGPASITKIINDLDSPDQTKPATATQAARTTSMATYAALAMSAAALAISLNRRNRKK